MFDPFGKRKKSYEQPPTPDELMANLAAVKTRINDIDDELGALTIEWQSGEIKLQDYEGAVQYYSLQQDSLRKKANDLLACLDYSRSQAAASFDYPHPEEY